MFCVYLVVAGEVREPQTLTPLGAFNNESLAQAFIDLSPLPQRRRLGIQRWEINATNPRSILEGIRDWHLPRRIRI